MPRIVRAEFLSYTNARRNSDKLFNVFLIEDDGYFSCVSEYGRRGTNLVRDTLCAGATREFAESKLRQKLAAKRDHRETPYTDEPVGYNYSPIAREYGYGSRAASGSETNSNRTAENAPVAEAKVIEFPVEKNENRKNKPQPAGIFNQGQFDSLEI
jgi:hypothetical protein